MDRRRIIVFGSIDGDGKQDLAKANFTSNNVSVRLGNGTGGFGPATNFAVGQRPSSVAAGGFNADGKQDLATVNYAGRDNNTATPSAMACRLRRLT